MILLHVVLANSKAQVCVDLTGGWLSTETIEAIKSKVKAEPLKIVQ